MTRSTGVESIRGRLFVLEKLEGQLDAVDRKLVSVLIGGRQDGAVLDRRLDRRDVVEADDQDLAGSAGRLDRGQGTQAPCCRCSTGSL